MDKKRQQVIKKFFRFLREKHFLIKYKEDLYHYLINDMVEQSDFGDYRRFMQCNFNILKYICWYGCIFEPMSAMYWKKTIYGDNFWYIVSAMWLEYCENDSIR